MRTIEEVVKDIKSGEWAYDEAYSSGYDKLCGLLDEILEISKANNESVKGDLISRSALKKAIRKSTCHWAEQMWKQVVCDVIDNQPTAYNDGWIPCSERLPIGEEYRKNIDGEWHYRHLLVTTKEEDALCYVGWYDQKDEVWYDLSGFVFYPIAWQPLPVPYQPKGE